MKERLRDLMGELAERGCIRIGKYKLTSSQSSPYYIDLRTIPSHPELFERVCDQYIHTLNEHGVGFDRIAGIPTASIPLATLLAYKTKKPFLYLRKGERLHGTRSSVEGELNPGDVVLVVDDVATTGRSLKWAVEVLRGHGAEVAHAVVLVDREQGARKNLRNEGVELIAVTTAKELIKELYLRGNISNEEYRKVMDYIEEGRDV